MKQSFIQKLVAILHWKMGMVFVGVFAFAANVSAQEAKPDILEAKFDVWRKDNLQEKIYVHTDRTSYLTGEICWFKIYHVNGYSHQLIDFGKVAYVEVIDLHNVSVLQAKISLEKGTGNGSFSLPSNLVSGTYKIRAYTNWMKNFGPDYFFEKEIVIVNVQKTEHKEARPAKPLYDIGFFPEGGNLINGITTKVGFKVSNQWGKGVSFTGLLLNGKGDTIRRFSPLKFGMGNFTFTPMAGTQYRAVVNLPGGEQQVKPLPAAVETGYTLQLDNNKKGQLKISVQTKEAANGYPVFLFVQTRGLVKMFLKGEIQDGETEFLIDDTRLGEGISQLTLFNSNRQPVCERLYFKQPQHNLQIAAVADQQVYGVRKKINIAVSTGSKEVQGAAADMSMSVYKIDSLVTTEECNINHYLLLNADISGLVESPAYYFLTGNDTAINAADNLMLTQGWRRFRWDDVQQNKTPSFSFLPELYGHIITGKLIPIRAGLPVKDVPVYITVPGLRTQFQTGAADAAGKIKFDMKDLYSDGDVIVQTNNEKDSGYRLEIDTPFFNRFSQKQLTDFNSSAAGNAVLERYIASQVQNTFLHNKLNHAMAVTADTAAFYAQPDATYLLDNYVRFTTLEEVFREYVQEVNVRKPGGRFHLPVYDAGTKTIFSTQPLVLLDGLPVFNIDKIMSYDPLKIRKLEVISRRYFLRDNAFDGIINLTTYKGNLDGFEIDPRAAVIDYEGLQARRDFYSPVYATGQQQQSRMPDFRNVLLWLPDLNTSAAGKTQADFYSSDVPGKYVVVIEGLAKDGNAGEGITYFEVKK